MGKKKIGVVLSGCGVYDGSEVHEATLTLFFLDKAGAEAVVIAPQVDQHHVIDHTSGDEMDQTRNVWVESARIARKAPEKLSEVTADQLDGVILPGGFGAAKNLSSVAFDGPEATVLPDLAALVGGMYQAKKPIGAICISPAVVSKILSDQGIVLTIGSDEGTAQAIETMGNKHQQSEVNEIVVDENTGVISTPAYMCAASIAEVGAGIEKLVAQVVKRA